MNQERQEFLQKKINRADRAMKVTGIGAAFAVLIMLGIIIGLQFQVQQQISKTLDELTTAAKENHEETRNYFKCIAQDLLVPVAERATINFDNCDILTQKPTVQDAVPSASPTDPQSIASPSRPATSVQASPETPSNQVTTSAPPDPTPVEAGQKDILHGIPVVGNLLDTLGL